MKKADLFQAFDGVDDDILERSEASATRRKPSAFRRWAALAACLLLAVGLTCFTVVSEAKEYNAAVEFFGENGLSTEGLSREDVKAVYRDITTRQFSYDKTAEVLERAVPGFEIDQGELTPEELARQWDTNIRENAQQGKPKVGISYRTNHSIKTDETLGWDGTIVECYRDGKLLWTVEFPELSVWEYKLLYTTFGTLAWGGNYYWSEGQPVYYHALALVDDAGNILWEHRIDTQPAKVFDNEDGTFEAIGSDSSGYLSIWRYDTDGNELSFSRTEVDESVLKIVRLEDGYLVQVGGSSIYNRKARLVKLDGDGTLIDSFVYEGEDCDYHIIDMIEFENRMYLSAYAVPKQINDRGRGEIANILDYVYNNPDFDFTNNEETKWIYGSEELTAMVRDNYTAVLLLCDPNGRTPETFYSVKGSLCGDLSVNDAGELTWDVSSVVKTYYSPATSSFTIGGTCRVFRYTFDTAGNLIGQEDTGKTVEYHR